MMIAFGNYEMIIDVDGDSTCLSFDKTHSFVLAQL